jgi:hypothetical protein
MKIGGDYLVREGEQRRILEPMSRVVLAGGGALNDTAGADADALVVVVGIADSADGESSVLSHPLGHGYPAV